MAVSILEIDDFESEDFNLIAIHSSLEDYKLAYLINRTIDITLQKSLKPLVLTKFDFQTTFEIFKFDDEENKTFWSLIHNRSYQTKVTYISEVEFNEVKIYSDIQLIPEYQNVDYFIKIDESQNQNYIQSLLLKLNQILGVEKAFEINEKESLLSINNLLF
nr:IPExxxVDY family protein [uncultured Flavobacterium sp.]